MYTGFLITAVTAGHGERPLWAESAKRTHAVSRREKRRLSEFERLTGREAPVIDGGHEADAVPMGAAGGGAQHVPWLR